MIYTSIYNEKKRSIRFCMHRLAAVMLVTVSQRPRLTLLSLGENPACGRKENAAPPPPPPPALRVQHTQDTVRCVSEGVLYSLTAIKLSQTKRWK